MNKNRFMEFMENKFDCNKLILDILEGIWNYAEKQNNSIYNYTLEDLLVECGFDNDLSREEIGFLCKTEDYFKYHKEVE